MAATAAASTRPRPSGTTARSLAALVEPDRFPALARILASGVFEPVPDRPDPEDPAADSDLTFGLMLGPAPWFWPGWPLFWLAVSLFMHRRRAERHDPDRH